MDYCPNCGSEAPASGDYCDQCGQALDGIDSDTSSSNEPFFMRYINKLLTDWDRWNSQTLGAAAMGLGVLVYFVTFVTSPPAFFTFGTITLEVVKLLLWTLLFGFVAAVIDDLL